MRLFFCLILILTLAGVIPDPGLASRTTLTADQKKRLARAQVLAIQALALTENGEVDASDLSHLVGTRLKNLGYDLAAPSAPHDVLITVKCEERKRWVGLSNTGGDADRPGAPSRLWTGPACLFRYQIDGKQGPWEYEVRTSFEQAWKAAQKAKEPDPGIFALKELAQRLHTSDFPLQLSAHWNQAPRLAGLLQAPDASDSLKRKILSLAPHLSGPVITQALEELLDNPTLAVPATLALGQVGEEATPILLRQLQAATTTDLQTASVKALGEIGSRSGNLKILPPLLTMLDRESLPLTLQTEIVRVLGKIPDQQSLPVLQTINQRAWTSRSTDPRMQELREATDWSLWQVNPDAHTDE